MEERSSIVASRDIEIELEIFTFAVMPTDVDYLSAAISGRRFCKERIVLCKVVVFVAHSQIMFLLVHGDFRSHPSLAGIWLGILAPDDFFQVVARGLGRWRGYRHSCSLRRPRHLVNQTRNSQQSDLLLRSSVNRMKAGRNGQHVASCSVALVIADASVNRASPDGIPVILCSFFLARSDRNPHVDLFTLQTQRHGH